MVDSGPFSPIKRYDLGTRFYNSLSVPEIVETPEGAYVKHQDYLTILKINDYLQARLVKQATQLTIAHDRHQRMEPIAWINEDELPTGYPYDAMFPYSKVDIVRMFPVFAPQATVPKGYALVPTAPHPENKS